VLYIASTTALSYTCSGGGGIFNFCNLRWGSRPACRTLGARTSSKHLFTSRHGRISNGSPKQRDIAGENRAHSGTHREGTSGQEAERVEKPRHATPTDIGRANRVNMQCLAHPRSRDSVTSQGIQEIKPQISRIRAIMRGSRAAEKEMLNAAPAAFHKGVPRYTFVERLS
jgi:hypothetical protein